MDFTKSSFDTNNSSYTSYKFANIRGKSYSLLVVKGKHNYFNVACTSNPWKSIGTDFPDYFKAKEHYKSNEMKSAIQQVINIELQA